MLKQKKIALSITAILFAAILGLVIGGLKKTENRVDNQKAQLNGLEANIADYNLGNLSIPFIPNEGQSDPAVKYYSPLGHGMFFVDDKGVLVYRFSSEQESTVIRETIRTDKPIDAKPGELAPTVINVIKGSDSAQWKENLPSYKQISLGQIYDGIELTLHNKQSNVEKVFTIGPKADPSKIQIQLEGGQALDLGDDGELLIADGISLSQPVAYQMIGGEEVNVEVTYKVLDESSYGFELGAYDKSQPLIIDPILRATFLGGTGSYSDEIRMLRKNTDDNNFILAGNTQSSDFPTPGTPYDSTINNGVYYYTDLFLAKMDSTLSTLLVATFYGGPGSEIITDMEVGDNGINDSADRIFVTGTTYYTLGLAMHPNAYDSTRYPTGNQGTGFMAVFDNNLSALLGSTHLDNATVSVLEINSNNKPVICGIARYWSSYSYRFPTLIGGQPGYDKILGGTTDSYCAIFNEDITTLENVTLLGGAGSDYIYNGKLDNNGYLWLTGYTNSADFETTVNAYDRTYKYNFISKITAVDLSAGAANLPYSTFFGSASSNFSTTVQYDLSTPGKLYTYGYTNTNDYPATSGAYKETRTGDYDAVLTKWNIEPDGSLTMDASSYLGGTNAEFPYGLQVNSTGDIFLTGKSYSYNYPRVCPIRTSYQTGEIFISQFSSDLTTLKRSTFFGGNHSDDASGIYIDGSDNIYLYGTTSSSDFPQINAPGVAPTWGYDGTYSTSNEGFVLFMDSIDNGGHDDDSDNWPSSCDNCPDDTNADQADGDGDTVGNVCDNCSTTYNPTQTDTDSDTLGDACDNCPSISNLAQTDTDLDSIGDACDNCPANSNHYQEDDDGDGTGNVCDPDWVDPGKWPAPYAIADYPSGGGPDQAAPRAILASDGNFIIAWADPSIELTSSDIFIQKLNASDGTAFTGWPNGGIRATNQVGNQPYNSPTDFAIVSDGAGGAFLAWSHEDTGGDDIELYIQHVLSDGTLQFGTSGINVTTETEHLASSPQLAYDGTGGVYIAWTHTDSKTWVDDVRLNRINGTTGVREWVSDEVMTLSPSARAMLLTDSGNNVYVAYINNYAVGAIEKFTSAGARPAGWAAPITLMESTGDVLYQYIVSDGSDGVISAYYWTDGRGAEKVRTQRIFSDGTAHTGGAYDTNWLSGGTEGLTLRTAASPDHIQAASDGAGGVYVVWDEWDAGWSYQDIRGSRVSGATGTEGQLMWGLNGKVLSNGTDGLTQRFRNFYSIAMGDPLIISFEDRSSSPYKVTMQRISESGSLVWPEAAPVTAGYNFMSAYTSGPDSDPVIVGDGTGGAAIFWLGGTPFIEWYIYDVYGQYHQHDAGSVPPPPPEGAIEIHLVDNGVGDPNGESIGVGISNGDDAGALSDLDFTGAPAAPTIPISGAENYSFSSGEPTQSTVALNFETLAGTEFPASGGGDLNDQDDDISTIIPFGFTTKIYGRDVDSVIVSSNGLVFLNDSSSFGSPDDGCCGGASMTNYGGLPSTVDGTAFGDILVAAKWTDMDPSAEATASISYTTDGTAPNRRFVITFENIPYSGDLNLNNFQVKILETASEVAVVSGGATSARQCTVNPPQLDLPRTLDVIQQDGKPVVEINWGDTQLYDASASEKINVLFDYLTQSPAPQMDSTGKPLAGILTRHIYNQIYESGNNTLIDAFETHLRRTAQSEGAETLNLLNAIGINYKNDYFSEWWPYLFVEKLQSNRQVAEAFMSAVTDTLNKDPINYREFITILLNKLSKIQRSPQEAEVAQCISNAVAGMNLDDFIPGKIDSAYDQYNGQLEDLLEQIKQDTYLISTLDALKNDRQFIETTTNSLKVGINALLFSWVSNSNVQRIIDYYQTDDTARRFREIFFKADTIKKIETCAKTSYKQDLMSLVSDARTKQIKKAIEENEVCDENVSAILLEVIKKMVDNPNTQEAMQEMMLKFINETLSLEKHLTGTTSYRDYFSDYFNSHYRSVTDKKTGDYTLKIYREGKLIHTIKNPSTTFYLDETIPDNTTGRVKAYKYYLSTETECSTKTGSSGVAQIDPVLFPNTTIDVYADIKVKVKNGYDSLFADKLSALVEAAKKNNSGTSTGVSGQNTHQTQLACGDAKKALNVANPNSDTVLNYILACHGNDVVNPILKEKRVKILPPLMLALKLNQTEEDAMIIDQYIEPIITELMTELWWKDEVFAIVGGDLAKINPSKSITNFSEAEKETILCGGIPNCESYVKDKIEKYFEGSSHAIELMVDSYTSAEIPVNKMMGKTNIFGEIDGLYLGQFLSGQEYILRTRPANQKYVLPKRTIFTLNTAQPQSNGTFKATLDLSYGRQFRYGNFDETDDIINLKDIVMWGQLMAQDPEAWNDSNLDGLYGVDLLDAITFQQNWGEVQESRIEESQITITELAEIFGLSSSLPSKVQVPTWLDLIKMTCH